MTTSWPLFARTMESDSRTVLRASGSVWLIPPIDMFFC